MPVRLYSVCSELELHHCAGVSRTGYTFLDEWRDAAGNIHQVEPGKGNYTITTEDLTLYAQWQCNHTIGGVEFRDNGDGTHDGYCGECGEPLSNYVERPHAYDESTGFCECGVENILPTGTITIKNNDWDRFWNWLSFGIFCEDYAEVSVTADGTGSDVVKVEYLFYSSALNEGNMPSDGWTEVVESSGVYKFSIQPQNKGAVYVRITDAGGNVSVINSEGIVVYEDSEAVITEINYTYLENSNKDITPEGNKNATYTIKVIDKAGNSTTVTVTMKPIKDLAGAIENLSNGNVTSDDEQALKELVARLDELLADPDVSEGGEKETLEQHKAIAESLLKTIKDAAEATTSENTEKVKDVTAENVTPENKSDLEKAKADLEKALEDKGGNYTDEEKKTIQEEINRIDDAITTIENIEDVSGSISSLPESVEPDDEAATAKILAAKEDYDSLTDYEKSLVDEIINLWALRLMA